MEYPERFDSIRPYHDHEVKPAIERMVSHPRFESVLKYLYEDEEIGELTAKFRSIETIDQFQQFFSSYTVGKIIDKTSDGLTAHGFENIDLECPYLFVGNHRDIVLDAAIMQWLLNKYGHKTSQITFGTNLMTEQLLLDMGKLNKMFTFFRGGSKIEQYHNALNNSAYINHVIKEQKESIWIAQRNGRTKNGDDETQTGLIKMFTVGNKDIINSLAGLNIVPVTISYEIEPCDLQKVRELYIARREPYVKEPNEDYMSILAGITGTKGRVNYNFGKPLNEFILALGEENLHTNELIDRITREIDRQIHQDYFLWPSNYLAFDLLNQTDEYRDLYSDEDMKLFEGTTKAKSETLEGFDQAELRTMFLEMYANPVVNRRALHDH